MCALFNLAAVIVFQLHKEQKARGYFNTKAAGTLQPTHLITNLFLRISVHYYFANHYYLVECKRITREFVLPKIIDFDHRNRR